MSASACRRRRPGPGPRRHCDAVGGRGLRRVGGLGCLVLVYGRHVVDDDDDDGRESAWPVSGGGDDDDDDEGRRQ